MKHGLSLVLGFCLFIVSINAQQKNSYLHRAEETFRLVWDKYHVPQYGLFSEHYPKDQQTDLTYFNDGNKKAKAVSFLWPYSGMASAINLLYELDSTRYAAMHLQIIESQEEYLDTTRLPYGYQAYPSRFEQVDRYYDDNGLVGIDYIDAFAVTKNPLYLERAKRVFEFIISGWDDVLGGGVTWLEGVRDQKPACSNGKATVLALKIHQQTQDEYYLTWGLKFYNWMYTHLRDSSGIYWNDMKTADRSVLKTAWTYNTGTMLQAAVALYKATGDPAFLEEAQYLAKGSFDFFGKPMEDGRTSILDVPWFTTVLFRGYQDLFAVDGNPAYVDAIMANVNYAYEHARDRNGLFYADWNGEKDEWYTPKWLLDQACIPELYARFAQIERHRASWTTEK
ncbi:glycoside hydrolase family 76 protein [Parapedobacter tibetensis]|uniref:glycoside hydrolase family 76 protein n=1 Tax=Parapedobacter tibetensis TaxID=2972951 RepID=UPI00214DD888|nr:glycoside hydrolase family 76 protein [Parapedobacter tibetensis]